SCLIPSTGCFSEIFFWEIFFGTHLQIFPLRGAAAAQTPGAVGGRGAADSLWAGALLFADVKGPPTHRLSCGQSPYAETTTWERKYCVLTDSQLLLLNREKEVPVDGVPDVPAEAAKGRCLRRTVSVPSEGQFPEYPPEGAVRLGKCGPCIRATGSR
uniref:PH domain-containing protein n=1 Tax=Nothoprocta perdicaria TaxID=30464 RepID=A0A8C6ZM80_NOTPE